MILFIVGWVANAGHHIIGNILKKIVFDEFFLHNFKSSKVEKVSKFFRGKKIDEMDQWKFLIFGVISKNEYTVGSQIFS